MARTRAAGLREVATHAGVSVSSVSRVINGGPYVTAALRARVEASMRAVGYEPHALARSLRTGQTHSVGYVISDIANAMFATIASGLDDALRPAGYTTLLASSRGEAAQDLALIGELRRRRVDGLVLSLADDADPAVRAGLREVEVPLVLLDREPAGVRADRVLVDHHQGVAAAVAHLHGLGHRRIALVTGGDATRPGRAIAAAFGAAAAERGLAVAPADRLAGPFTPAFGAAAVHALLARPEPPTAILVGGAQLTAGALRAVRERGVRIPEQLSLVAYDDTDVTALFSPAVTVVARDVHRIGAEAGRLLLDRLAGRYSAARSRTVVVPTRLVVRGSTGPAPGGR